jgi:hypothetical protein
LYVGSQQASLAQGDHRLIVATTVLDQDDLGERVDNLLRQVDASDSGGQLSSSDGG